MTLGGLPFKKYITKYEKHFERIETIEISKINIYIAAEILDKLAT